METSLQIWVEQMEAETIKFRELITSGEIDEALRQACVVLELQTGAIAALLKRSEQNERKIKTREAV